MMISRKSFVSGKINTLDLPVTQEELDRWKPGGEHAQNV